MRRKCLNPGCTEYFTPSRENRPYTPCCSSECLQAYRAGRAAAQPTLALVAPPGIWRARGSVRWVNRRIGRQNWKGSE